MRNQHNIRNIDVSRAKRARRPAPAAPRRSAYDVQKDVQRPVSRGGSQGGAARRPAGQSARRPYDVQRDTAYARAGGSPPLPARSRPGAGAGRKRQALAKKLPLALCLCCASWQWGRPGSTGMWRILWPRAKAARLRRISPPRPSTAKTSPTSLCWVSIMTTDPAEQALGVQQQQERQYRHDFVCAVQ